MELDQELLHQLLEIILPAAATLLAAWFAVLGNKIKTCYEEKINTQIRKDIVKETVNYVEQVYKTLKGDEKLSLAVDKASKILVDRGIPVSTQEITMLIESAVYGLNQGFKGDKKEVK